MTPHTPKDYENPAVTGINKEPAHATLTPYASQASALAGDRTASPYFKIHLAGTERALAVTENDELEAVNEYDGAPEQLWRIEPVRP